MRQYDEGMLLMTIAGKPEAAETGADAVSDVARPVDTYSVEKRPFKRMIRRGELRQIVPLADTTIYELEQRGEFPRRFNLTARCVVWDLAEVEAWIQERRRASEARILKRTPFPQVRLRRVRPVRS